MTREKENENDILFSKSVKAGKRIYYIDVKRDRKGEFYISMTESKRVKDAGDAQHPVFEKHKLFLYREDLEKFQKAFNEAAQFTQAHAPLNEYASDWNGPADNSIPTDEPTDNPDDYKINIEF